VVRNICAVGTSQVSTHPLQKYHPFFDSDDVKQGLEKLYRYCQYIDKIDILEEILGYFDLLQYLFLRKKVLLKVLQLE
jgi:hypothetical protein